MFFTNFNQVLSGKCIFGDSAAWGAWDLEKGGWANRLQLYLESKIYDVFVYNLGVSGDTTNELLKRFDAEAKAREPTVIIFLNWG